MSYFILARQKNFMCMWCLYNSLNIVIQKLIKLATHCYSFIHATSCTVYEAYVIENRVPVNMRANVSGTIM